MTSDETAAFLRRSYDAYAAMDIPAIDASMADDAVMHISGDHPLAGDYRGKAEIWGYLGKVAEISGGDGGWQVDALTANESGYGVALLTGTIRGFVRPVIHVWRLAGGMVTELWDAYLDAEQEDAFWTEACGRRAEQ
jgi:hypothetical protein